MKMKKVIFTVIAAGLLTAGISLFINEDRTFKSVCDSFRAGTYEEEPLTMNEAATFLSETAVARAKDFTSFSDVEKEDRFFVFDFGSKVSGYSIFSSLKTYCSKKGGKDSGGVLIWRDKDSVFTASLIGPVLTISQGQNEMDMFAMQDALITEMKYIPHVRKRAHPTETAEAE